MKILLLGETGGSRKQIIIEVTGRRLNIIPNSRDPSEQKDYQTDTMEKANV